MTPHDNESSSSPDVTFAGDRYAVESLVGAGGGGRVYRARQVELNRIVAIKVLRRSTHANDEATFEKRFRREAETLARFHHPNIVQIYDFGTTESGQLFLAMEFVEGPRLSDLIKQGPMTLSDTLPLILQVCEGLRYAHGLGAVHRDLKPGNILIREHGGGRQVKLVDFGLVKLVDQESSITHEGYVLGSPHYMAPEQIRGEGIDHRVDIYALGVVLFRCLSGGYPFKKTGIAATMMGHLNDPVPRLREVAPDVDLPAGLEELIARCMQKDPNDRFDTVDAIVERLHEWVEPSSTTLRSGPSTVSRTGSIAPNAFTSNRRRRRTPVVAGLATLLGMAGGITMVLLGGGSTDVPAPTKAVDFADPPQVVVTPGVEAAAEAAPPPEPPPAPRTIPVPADPAPTAEEVQPEAVGDLPPAGYLGLPEDL